MIGVRIPFWDALHPKRTFHAHHLEVSGANTSTFGHESWKAIGVTRNHELWKSLNIYPAHWLKMIKSSRELRWIFESPISTHMQYGDFLKYGYPKIIHL